VAFLNFLSTTDDFTLFAHEGAWTGEGIWNLHIWDTRIRLLRYTLVLISVHAFRNRDLDPDKRARVSCRLPPHMSCTLPSDTEGFIGKVHQALQQLRPPIIDLARHTNPPLALCDLDLHIL
jgi:hypothetical protein